MEKKTKGSWLIHHTNKLQAIVNQSGYENIFLAGKAGILLSAISSDMASTVSMERVRVLATAANINTKFELVPLLKILRKNNLIDVGGDEIAVLGVTTTSTLIHAATIFEESEPSNTEQATLQLSEAASERPISSEEALGLISTSLKVPESNAHDVLTDSEQIGFVDVEKIDENNTLYFNGNLFRRETTKKVNLVLRSLTATERGNLTSFMERLKASACIPVATAKKQLGEELFSKVNSIGLFDVNVVSNSTENVGFLTLPSAFSKYSSSMEEDAFDLAKAFVSSLTYGMTQSTWSRGSIRRVEALLGALINGEAVGPVAAIGEDYKMLELKGVVRVFHGSKKGRSGPMLKLLKKEVGELALQAISSGDVSEHSLTSFPTAAVTKFHGPEYNRERIRKKQRRSSPSATNDMLSILRTGGGF